MAREANDDDASKRAHDQALAARADMEAASGIRDLRRRRIVSFVAGLPAHRPVATNKGVKSIFRLSKKPSRITEQRSGIARILMDELGTILGGRPENLETATLLMAELGYHGPQGRSWTSPPASGRRPCIGGPIPTAGLRHRGDGPSIPRLATRSAPKGSATAVHRSGSLARCCIFALIGPPRRPGPKPTNKPHFRVSLEKAERVVAAAWADIEDESKDREPDAEPGARSDLSPRVLFRVGWREGDAARRGNCINKSLKLRTK